MTILYTIGCPKCKVLEKKLVGKNIDFQICDDIETIKKLGYDQLPILKVDNNVMNFNQAVEWINQLKKGDS